MSSTRLGIVERMPLASLKRKVGSTPMDRDRDHPRYRAASDGMRLGSSLPVIGQVAHAAGVVADEQRADAQRPILSATSQFGTLSCCR
jgi:hypothetical protein